MHARCSLFFSLSYVTIFCIFINDCQFCNHFYRIEWSWVLSTNGLYVTSCVSCTIESHTHGVLSPRPTFFFTRFPFHACGCKLAWLSLMEFLCLIIQKARSLKSWKNLISNPHYHYQKNCSWFKEKKRSQSCRPSKKLTVIIHNTQRRNTRRLLRGFALLEMT